MERIIAISFLIASDYRQEILGILLILFFLLLILRLRIQKIRRQKKIKPLEQTTYTPDAGISDQAPESIVSDHNLVIEAVVAESEDVEGGLESDTYIPAADEVQFKEKPEKIIKEPQAAISFFDRLKTGLLKTRQNFSKRFDGILSGNRKIDDDLLEEIEEVLITSDVGVPTTMELINRISQKSSSIKTADEFKSQLKTEMFSFINLPQHEKISTIPHVIMMVGVNGVGKTTTIGKLAAKYVAQGNQVLLSASDTFRAAAVEQLQIWADRAGAEIVRHRDKADPAAVAFDSVEAAIARGTDIVIVDTAGRIQTKINLMEQLKKIKRSISKNLSDAPHEVLLVLDATTGQNAVSQAKLFHEGIGITGIILSKLDGTAKGGIILSICHTLNIPIRYIGIGEGIDDLQEYDPKLFIDALL